MKLLNFASCDMNGHDPIWTRLGLAIFVRTVHGTITMTRISDIPDMPALRAQIDDLDAQLMALMARRHALIDRAAQIKSGNGMPARIDKRVEEVVANVRRHAEAHGLNPQLYDALWRQLIEAAIHQEERLLNKDRP